MYLYWPPGQLQERLGPRQQCLWQRLSQHCCRLRRLLLELQRLALQLQRTLDTFERQATNFAVRRLWVLPRTRDRQFADLLASHVALPVEPVRLEGLFDLSAVQPGWDSAPFERYVHLLGAAVGRLDGVLDASLPA